MRLIRALCLSIAFYSLFSSVRGQSIHTIAGKGLKRVIDSSVYDKWASVVEGEISNDGKFACYIIENAPGGYRTGVVRSLLNSWRFVIPYISGAITIASNSRIAVWKNSNDSLGIAELGTPRVIYYPDVSSFQMKGDYLFFRPKGIDNKLVLRHIKTGKLSSYVGVTFYHISDNGKVIILLQVGADGKEQVLNIANEGNSEVYSIWRGGIIDNITMDSEGRQLAFIVKNEKSRCQEVCLYDISSHSLRSLVCDSSIGIENGMSVSGILKFSENRQRLYITLGEGIPQIPQRSNAVQVDVWSYNDLQLQSQQLTNPLFRNYTAVIDVNKEKIVQLEYPDEWLILPNPNYGSDEFVLIGKQQSNGLTGEIKWNASCRVHWYLVSTNNASRKSLSFISDSKFIELSPCQRYIIYFNKELDDYFSYEIATGEIRNLTQNIKEVWTNDKSNEYYRNRSIGGWVKNDAAILIYGRNDIWQIDPSGKVPPLNLTNAYGREHNLIFTLAMDPYNQRCLSPDEMLFISAFNRETKDGGFYKKKLGSIGNPDSLIMGPYVYDITENRSIQSLYGFRPVKALNAEKYIVKRMSATDAPNYFVTTDFKKFKAISDLQPQKYYNWYTSELHSWRSFDGMRLKGILYKPENFDSSKKYPVIIHYYEKRSDALNAYLSPEALAGECNISIPYYVSNGYLVFCPDIHYIVGDPMEGTYASIVSAALYLMKLSFVNPKKMAIQGGSWGGIQTNYLVTRTGLFAAACSASGMADWVSGYGSLQGHGASLQGMYEVGQFRMGGTLWELKDKYIKNSPVFSVDKISTPILLMHTQNDDICPFSNIVEFFTALRRLHKRSWMLVYPGNHGISGSEAKDYSIRMKQFFDHYLMDSLPPIWMTRGIPAGKKGVITGLELDDSIRMPLPMLTTNGQ
ncbi:MAG: S9 family peptidase [Chitinophaga sp.]|uniref:alpha/beta hydrolase family protein n=1 Tax=Chitinophaga sp. TaxID=1869181 RepID=UPI001B1AD225|nr:prolyl oligopeptidase family serine peptidase [Chitinophaga sp.]MBO9727314.1 S9 family peptidase [Chitinophaga sp.]